MPLTPQELRELASLSFKTLRAAANEIERQCGELIHSNTQALIYEEVVDSLSSREKEKLQLAMSQLRAKIAVLNSNIFHLNEELDAKKAEIRRLQGEVSSLMSQLQ